MRNANVEGAASISAEQILWLRVISQAWIDATANLYYDDERQLRKMGFRFRTGENPHFQKIFPEEIKSGTPSGRVRYSASHQRLEDRDEARSWLLGDSPHVDRDGTEFDDDDYEKVCSLAGIDAEAMRDAAKQCEIYGWVTPSGITSIVGVYDEVDAGA
jgi:hypothetical protein